MSLFVNLGEVGVEPSFTEQGGVPFATVLLEVVKAHPTVFADWLLFGKFHVGNEVAVFLAVCYSDRRIHTLRIYVYLTVINQILKEK